MASCTRGTEIGKNGQGGSLIAQAISKMRRFWLVKAHWEYVEAQRELRTGECARCGRCCAVFFRCPFLSGNTCVIYGKRFHQCRAFPIDARDTELIRRMGGKCGFEFRDERT